MKLFAYTVHINAYKITSSILGVVNHLSIHMAIVTTECINSLQYMKLQEFYHKIFILHVEHDVARVKVSIHYVFRLCDCKFFPLKAFHVYRIN